MEERCGVTAVSLVSTIENILKNEHLVPTGARFDFGGEACIHIKDAPDGEEASRELVSEITSAAEEWFLRQEEEDTLWHLQREGKDIKVTKYKKA